MWWLRGSITRESTSYRGDLTGTTLKTTNHPKRHMQRREGVNTRSEAADSYPTCLWSFFHNLWEHVDVEQHMRVVVEELKSDSEFLLFQIGVFPVMSYHWVYCQETQTVPCQGFVQRTVDDCCHPISPKGWWQK